MKHIHKRLTYANVMSSIAVFLVIGGGAAFAALGANTVGTAQLKRNAVKTGKIGPEAVKAGKLAKNAVTTNRLRDNVVATSKIANDAVTADKIANDAVTTEKLANGSVTNDKIANNAVTAGKTDGSIQKSGDLLFATVAPANAEASIVRGRGATAVARIATGFYAVTFNRNVTGCSWLATYGQPNNAGVNAVWATVRGFEGSNQVGVVLRNEAGAQVDGNGFHLAVFC